MFRLSGPAGGPPGMRPRNRLADGVVGRGRESERPFAAQRLNTLACLTGQERRPGCPLVAAGARPGWSRCARQGGGLVRVGPRCHLCLGHPEFAWESFEPHLNLHAGNESAPGEKSAQMWYNDDDPVSLCDGPRQAAFHERRIFFVIPLSSYHLLQVSIAVHYQRSALAYIQIYTALPRSHRAPSTRSGIEGAMLCQEYPESVCRLLSAASVTVRSTLSLSA